MKLNTKLNIASLHLFCEPISDKQIIFILTQGQEDQLKYTSSHHFYNYWHIQFDF